MTQQSKFSEAALEEAIIELLDKEGYPYVKGDTISREPGQVLLHADLRAFLAKQYAEDDITAQEIEAALTEALAGGPMPRGYSYELGGRCRQQDADLEATFMALGLSIVFVFLIMGVLFESFLLPLSIITSIPMAMRDAIQNRQEGFWWAAIDWPTGGPRRGKKTITMDLAEFIEMIRAERARAFAKGAQHERAAALTPEG